MKELLVILEKASGKILVSKLRAILLLKADFSIIYKIIFNYKILPTLKSKNLILAEIMGGRRSQSAVHVALNKKPIADISN